MQDPLYTACMVREGSDEPAQTHRLARAFMTPIFSDITLYLCIHGIRIDFPIHIDRISIGLPMVYCKGLQVEFSKS